MNGSITTKVRELVDQMTLDEKLAQLGSYWIHELQTKGQLDLQKVATKLGNGIGQITRIGGASTLDPVSAAKTANRLQRFLVEQTRLGIPAILHEECCCGAMVLGGTVYPQALGLAATFQPELAQAMTSGIRKQLRAIGARQALGPVLDLAVDARWGRVEETFGEDPTLACHFGVSYIQGLQGETLAEGVMATGKHFVGHSLSQGGLNCAPVRVGMRDVYNVYLAPFHAAIRDAGLAAIMNAYPELDGEVVAASRRFLTDLLRERLGFNGLLVADYEAILMIHSFHYVAPDLATAASLALRAGIDVELPSLVCYGDPLKTALQAGDISLPMIDLAVHRHLQKKSELGLFENPYVDEGRVLEVFEAPANRTLAREIARRSVVLLKNDGTLPLSKSVATLAVIGPNADCGRHQLGDYSYAAMREWDMLKVPQDPSCVEIDSATVARHEVRITTILEGIRAALSSSKVLYAQGCENIDRDTGGFDEAVAIAHQADAVVLVIGDRSGLTPSCTCGETRDSADLRLPGVQEELAKAVIAAGRPVVVVLVNGRPFAMPWLAENANAILEAWLPGQEGGSAVADVLFGDVNPGGRLPVTFPRSVGQVPIIYNAKPSGTGSHWYVDYVDEKATPLYPFGHGLSYTSFEYSDLRISRKSATAGECVDISLNVTNAGFSKGDEVVQLYVRDEFARAPRPVKELKGYVRVTLEPGASKVVTFHLPVDQLAFYDHDLNLVLEPGRIFVMVGSSSADIRLTGQVEIVGAATMPIEERVFVCPVRVD